MAFYLCFPDSRHLFKDDFKEQISSIAYEWVLGVRSVPGVHKEWVINDDIALTAANKSNVKVASTNERNFNKTLLCLLIYLKKKIF